MIAAGITSYDEMAVSIFFPSGHVCCDLCPLMETYARKQCRRTGEYLLETKTIGLSCPLVKSTDYKPLYKEG